VSVKIFFLSVFALSVDLKNNLPNVSADSGKFAAALNIVYGVTGAISVLVITIAGFRYIISRGDPNSVAQAKRAILYAVIGLLVTLSAFAITTFVVKGL
jgi:hypothetical protein